MNWNEQARELLQTIVENASPADHPHEYYLHQIALDKSKELLLVDDGQEGKGQAEDYLKASVGKALNIDFSKEQWYIDWWMLLDPQPSFRCIIRAMEAYKAALQVADGEGELALFQLAAENIEDENLSIKEKAFAKMWWAQGYKYAKSMPSAVTGGVKDAIEYFKRLAKNEYGASYNVNTIIHVLEEYENK